MELDDCKSDSWKGQFSRSSANWSKRFGLRTKLYSRQEIKDLEGYIWNLLKWADKQRLQSYKPKRGLDGEYRRGSIEPAKRISKEAKDKAIRIWLQPLVCATQGRMNLLQSEFLRKVGHISQQEVRSLLQLEHSLRRNSVRKRGSLGKENQRDTAEQCLLCLTQLHRSCATTFRKLMIKWISLEFSRSGDGESVKNNAIDSEINAKKMRREYYPSGYAPQPRASFGYGSGSRVSDVHMRSSRRVSQPVMQTEPARVSKLMVGNVKENKKFPSYGWIFPCTTCFQPTSNTYVRPSQTKTGLLASVEIHICEHCYKKYQEKIPQDIIDGSRTNTRVIRM